MKELGSWMRRIAAGTVMVLAITGLGATGAAAGTDAVPTGAVVLGGAPDNGLGVLHNAKTPEFYYAGCKYVGWSGHQEAGTEIATGSCNQSLYVRAWVCASSACFTTDWRFAPRRVTYTVSDSSKYRIAASFHKACGTCTVYRINH